MRGGSLALFATGLLVGAAAGVAIGMLYSSSETREMLGERAREAADRARELSRDATERAREAAERARSVLRRDSEAA